MERKATAIWKGGLKSGFGSVSTESTALTGMHYGYRTRFQNGAGTNPEELIAAAHASCFSMALASLTERAGFQARKLETKATVKMEQLTSGWTITSVHLDLKAHIPNIEKKQFDEIALEAKKSCPISQLLSSVTISLHSELDNSEALRKVG